MEFRHEITVRLYDTDAAGYLFFGAQFRLAHEALEEFMAHLGLSVGDCIRNREFLFPVVHAEADYSAPLAVGDRVLARVTVARVKGRSFALRFRFCLPDGRETGVVELVQVAVDAGTRAAIPIPAPMRAALESFRDS